MKTLTYALMFSVCIGICYLIVFVTNKLPGQHGVIHVDRESGNGTIYRMLDGVPHVHADSLEMGTYSLGFAMAPDRIFHMDKLRRLAQGRLSEIFGEATIDVDKAMRNYGFRYLAKMLYETLEPKTKELLDNFTDGVNDYLKFFSEGIEYWLLGTEFEEWKPEDSLSIYIYVMYSLSQDDGSELFRDYLYSKLKDTELVERLYPTQAKYEVEESQGVFTDEELKEFKLYKKNKKLSEPELQKSRKLFEFIEKNLDEELKLVKEITKMFSSGGASNCWAISGKYTKSGKPILVNDPHLESSMPSPFYMAEMNINDNFIVGALIPGVPMFVSARTNHISYGVTSLNADVADLFEEKIEGDKYLFKGEWKPLEVREEIIEVKDGKPETILVRATHHGPVLDHVGSILNAVDPSRPPLRVKADVAFSWTGYHLKDHVLNSMSKAIEFKNINEVFANFKGAGGGAYGQCYADDSGNIGWIAMTQYPKRKDEVAGHTGIKEGWSGKYEWEGFVTPDKIPSMINPKKGYVFSANNKVSSGNVEAGIGATQPSTARAIRLNYLLNDLLHVKKQKVDANDMKKILNDTHDVFAAMKTPLMISIVEKKEFLERYITNKQALKQVKLWINDLKKWNYNFDIDMKEPTLFTLWEIYFVDNLFKEQIENHYLRSHASMYYGYDDFLVKLLQRLDKDPTYFSNYCQAGGQKISEGCVKVLVEGLQFAYDFLVPAGTSLNEEDIKYGNWHKVNYRYSPFTKTILSIFFDKSDKDSGSKHTINVGSVYYPQFQANGLESQHVPNYRMIVDFGKEEDNQFSIDTGVSENIIGNYFYYNLHEAHMSLDMIPMGYNSINTTQTRRFGTIRLIYKNWFDEEEQRLKFIEESKKAEGSARGTASDKEDL